MIIVGFSQPDHWIDNVARAVLKNFFVAISERRLIVELKEGQQHQIIDSDTITQLFSDREDDLEMQAASQLYKAFISPDCQERFSVLEENDVEVYIKADSSYKRTIANFRATGISIPIKYSLNCNGIQHLIQQGEAVAVVTVKSSAASYSQLFRFPGSSNEMVIAIPKYSVVSKIDLVGAIIASQNISKFRCEGEFNDLYFGGSTFEIRKGDILATEDSRTIYVDDSELERPISSIFDICNNDEQEAPMMVAFEGEKIEIGLKRELFSLYCEFKDFNMGALRRYAAGIIVYPVLVDAIAYVLSYNQTGDDAGYSGRRWFRAIEKKLTNIGVDLATTELPSSTLANNLLGNIALDALKSFKDTLDSEVNSGETERIGGVD